MNSTAMEQIAKYWGMWRARRSRSTASPTIPWAVAYSGEPSCEEQAFARDAAANLGGCVWPPRSYPCSFCRREFRSAQALGGHMNVHRRDRARLRQCSSPDDVQEAPHDHPPHQDTFLYRAIPNPSTTTRPSVPAKGDVTSSSTTPPSYLSAIIKESKNKVLMSMPMSRPVREEAIDQYDHDDEEESGRAKRRCVDHPSVALPIFVRPVAAAAPAAPCEGKGLQGVVDHDHDAEVHKTSASPSSISPLVDRQVDLELRLGTTQS